MPKQGKSPKKKTKEKPPQRTGESEYPEMEQDEFNRLLQNAIEQSKAQLQQQHEEQIKVVEERLTTDPSRFVVDAGLAQLINAKPHVLKMSAL